VIAQTAKTAAANSLRLKILGQVILSYLCDYLPVRNVASHAIQMRSSGNVGLCRNPLLAVEE